MALECWVWWLQTIETVKSETEEDRSEDRRQRTLLGVLAYRSGLTLLDEQPAASRKQQTDKLPEHSVTVWSGSYPSAQEMHGSARTHSLSDGNVCEPAVLGCLE
jgi:hypothetical protein